MASAQVLPSSVASAKKKEHLQAGKRRLEEFRKKKAAAKNASSTNVPKVNLIEKQPLENEHARVTDIVGAGTYGGHGNAVIKSSSVAIDNGNKSIDSIQKNGQLADDMHISSPSLSSHYNSIYSDQPYAYSGEPEVKKFGDLVSGTSLDVNQNHGGKISDIPDYTGGFSRFSYGTTSDQSIALDSQGSQDLSSTVSLGMVETQLEGEKISSKDYATSSTGSFHASRISPQNSIGSLLQSELSNADGSKPSSLYEDLIRPPTGRAEFSDGSQKMHSSTNFSDIIFSKSGKENISTSASALYSMENGDVQTFGSGSFESNYRSSLNHIPLYPVTNETNSRRSRPSFLDHLNINKASPGTHFKKDEYEKDPSKNNGLSSKNMDFPVSSPFHMPSINAGSLSPSTKLDSISSPRAYDYTMNSGSDGIASNLPKLPVYENGMDMKHEFYLPPKQNEDFATLEQHIEDLTQEKFSLQRALETSRALAESLAAENSSLTESYNQQRGVVDQLKSDLENLQEEIKARLAELEAFRSEYANAQLECNAADERAKLLASEVITLEEKALRLRSNELKLERQLENSQAEISAYKKKMSSLEKDRMDLQSTIDALQEEKKLLQSKLRKASTSGKPIDAPNPSINKKDNSTSTEDLANEDDVMAISSQEPHDTSFLGAFPSSSAMFPVDGYSSIDDSFGNVPPHQLRMIQNISTLISELALEKQELVQALTFESSLSSKLKELNNELSRKLEAQTQRLELLTAQSMATGHVSTGQPESHDMPDNIQYADEGDEVVERVLGWIMKLFPGGPSRRRTSKLL